MARIHVHVDHIKVLKPVMTTCCCLNSNAGSELCDAHPAVGYRGSGQAGSPHCPQTGLQRITGHGYRGILAGTRKAAGQFNITLG